MSDYNDSQNLPVFSWPIGGLPVNEGALMDRKQDELTESAEERLNEKSNPPAMLGRIE